MAHSEQMRIGKRGGAAGVAIAAFIVAGTGSAAQGSPPVGTATQVLLGRATTLDEVKVNFNGIHLHTKDEVDIADIHFTANPGWSSGWHEHTGPAIVAVHAGALTIYQGSCHGVLVPAGNAFVERPGVPVVAHNNGKVVADWFTTEIIPVGTPTRQDVPARCGLR